jgi:sigma-B regulation protein RsbU (phosphoserine phosphatase)
MEDGDYEATSQKVNAGDRILIYSDGLSECENPNEVQYGEDQLAQFFNNQNNAPFEKLNSNIMNEITLWRRADQFADDLSAIIIEIK